jgi:hypothetical protein
MSNKIKVYNPQGYPPKITGRGMAPRPASLAGKTVYLVDLRFDDSDRFLFQMQAWFREHMPEVNTVFAQKDGTHTRDDPRLWQEIKEKADAAILGVGH